MPIVVRDENHPDNTESPKLSPWLQQQSLIQFPTFHRADSMPYIGGHRAPTQLHLEPDSDLVLASPWSILNELETSFHQPHQENTSRDSVKDPVEVAAEALSLPTGKKGGFIWWRALN